jgi:hypothetical protein
MALIRKIHSMFSTVWKQVSCRARTFRLRQAPGCGRSMEGSKP